jgi:hypothetical protein
VNPQHSTPLTRFAHMAAIYLLGGTLITHISIAAAELVGEGSQLPGLIELASIPTSTAPQDVLEISRPIFRVLKFIDDSGQVTESAFRAVAAGIGSETIEAIDGCQVIAGAYSSRAESLPGELALYVVLLDKYLHFPDSRQFVEGEIVRISIEYSELGLVAEIEG